MYTPKVDTEKRRLGEFGESEAVKLLKKKGYRIKKRNYAPVDTEIDIVAETKTDVVFIEVKTREILGVGKHEPRPASAVTPKKQRAIIECAKMYLSFYAPQKRVRFDIIEVYVERADKKYLVKEIKHLENTFNRNTANADIRWWDK